MDRDVRDCHSDVRVGVEDRRALFAFRRVRPGAGEVLEDAGCCAARVPGIPAKSGFAASNRKRNRWVDVERGGVNSDEGDNVSNRGAVCMLSITRFFTSGEGRSSS